MPNTRASTRTVNINLNAESDTDQNLSPIQHDMNSLNDSLGLLEEVMGGVSNEQQSEAVQKPSENLGSPPEAESKFETKPYRQGVQSIITVGSVNPRNFDGKDDIEDYISHFSYIANCNNWDPSRQRMRLPAHLRGVAELWYSEFLKQYKDHSGDPNSLTIDDIFDGLRLAFKPKNYQSMTQTALICRHQGLSEPVADYYYDIMRLCNKMNNSMSEGEKLTHVMKGLKSGMLEKVLVLEPKDCLDL